MNRSPAAFAVLLAACAAPPSSVSQPGPPLELAGRVAGPAEHCVSITPMESLRVSENDRHLLVYGNGRTIYANSIGQCRFGSDDVLVTEPLGSQYCRGDIVRSFDRQTHIPGPACVLSDFIPYTRVAAR